MNKHTYKASESTLPEMGKALIVLILLAGLIAIALLDKSLLGGI